MRHHHLRLVWLLFALAVVFFILAPLVHAEARYVARGKDVEIVLHDEDCALEAVANLPMRATWKEPDEKIVEGCWGVSNQGLVKLYFADRTVVVLPRAHFSPIGST